MKRPESPPARDLLHQIDVDYARYNGLKTFSDPRESAFEVARFGPLFVTHDVARDDGYYNRVVGFSRETAGQLADAVAVFPAEIKTVRVDVAVDDAAAVRDELERHQFAHTDTIHWLWRPLKQLANHHVWPCTAEDVAGLRPLLEAGRPPIPDALWVARSPYLVTSQFHTFAILSQGECVAMGSSFFYQDSVILGNAFTRPAFRGRGYHRRLLMARLNRAYELFRWRRRKGVAFVDVAPGTVSEQNCLKMGFHPFVHMEVWERQHG